MRIDVDTLETFNDLARDGAERAAESLAQLAGTPVGVEVTGVELVPVPDLAVEFAGTRVVGVDVGYSGGMDGSIVLVFDEDSARSLLDSMVPASMDDDGVDEAAITEAANIMVGGVLAAWGEHFESKLRPEPPEYVDGDWELLMPERMPIWDEHQAVVTFTSRITGTDDPIDFHIYVVPERASFESVVEGATGEDPPLSTDELSAFNEVTKVGARRASEKITTMTGIQSHVEIGRLAVVPTDELPAYVGDERRLGAVAHLEEAPGGHVAMLFDGDSAKAVGDALLPMEAEGFTDQHRAAIEEIGNVAVSGFIDGWANALERTIRHEPPEFVEGGGDDVIRPLLDAYDGDHVFVLDSAIRRPGGEISCDLVAVPSEDGFLEVIEELSLETATEAIYDPSGLEPSGYDELTEP